MYLKVAVVTVDRRSWRQERVGRLLGGHDLLWEGWGVPGRERCAWSWGAWSWGAWSGRAWNATLWSLGVELGALA